MQIVATFNNLEEIEEFCRKWMDKKAEEKPKKAEAPKEKPKKVEEPEDALPFGDEPKKAEAPEELKLEVKKLLAKANRTEGHNVAKEWIAQLGYKAFTEIDSEKDLTALKQLAEEVLNA